MIRGGLRASALQRVVTSAMSVVSILLVARWLSPAEQGFYYAFTSLFFLQMLFELGFSFALVNLVAHARAACMASPEDQTARDRLNALFRLGVLFGLTAGLVALLVIPASGWWFFTTTRQVTAEVAWQLPWLVASVALCALLPFQFMQALLEGSDQIEQVAWIRLAQDGLGHIALWLALWIQPGVWVVAAYMVVRLGVACLALMLPMPRGIVQGARSITLSSKLLDWRRDILPFQAGIAVSSVAGYLLCYSLNPVLFRAHGAEYAGRWGMSHTLLLAAASFSLLWVSTRVPLLCSQLAQGKPQQAWSEFQGAFLRGLMTYLTLVATLFAGLAMLRWFGMSFGERLLPWHELLLLSLAVLGYYVILGMNMYARAHRREDFAGLFATLGLATLVGGWWLASRVSTVHVNLAYAVLLAGIGSALAVLLARRRYAKGL